MSSHTYGRKTVALIQLMNRLKESEHYPTDEELAQMAEWRGWGGMAPAFEEAADEVWKELRAQAVVGIGVLFGDHGIRAMQRAILTSYFTDPLLVQNMWQMAADLGYHGGTVLDIGCGTGAFLAGAPEGFVQKAIGIECDPFSSLIAQKCVPQAQIITEYLQKVTLARESIDITIGNFPFGELSVYDPTTSNNFAIHNYCFIRAFQAMRTGGLLISVTSRHTLDNQTEIPRKWMEYYADFLGALRLPKGAFHSAQTDVITDILVFRKRDPNETVSQSRTWITASEQVVEGLRVNEYFLTHPEHILGATSNRIGRFGPELHVARPKNFPQVLAQATQSLIADAKRDQLLYIPRKDFTVIEEDLVAHREDGFVEGSYYLYNGYAAKIINGKMKRVTQYRDPITALILLRDAAVKLFEAERNLDCPDEELVPLRKALNKAYDYYKRHYGSLLSSKLLQNQLDEDGERTTIRKLSPQMAAFRSDLHFPTLVGLVIWNDNKRREEKADIFRQRIHRRAVKPSHAESINDAIALCLDTCGQLDLDVLGQLLSIEPAAVPVLMLALAYEDPVTGQWHTADDYLSGNIREKLRLARKAVEHSGPRFQRHVDDLAKVLPTPLKPEQIHGALGATWISPRDYEQFCFDLTGQRVSVSYEPVTQSWSIGFASGFPVVNQEEQGKKTVKKTKRLINVWETDRMGFETLVEHGLNNEPAIVWNTNKKTKERSKDKKETEFANERLQAIKKRFSAWIWEDPERTKRLTEVYNDIFRSEVTRTYNGNYLSFPEMNAIWRDKMYPWQKNFIARMVASRSGLCSHPVGAGKTLTMIATAMTLRRLGKITRAGIVVPNHLIEQITSEAKRLYPQARILMISRNDLTKENKAIFAAKVAAGDYDLVVMTHAALFGLGMPPELERDFLEEKMTEYRQVILRYEGSNNKEKKKTAKQLEKKLQVTEAKYEEMLKKEARGVSFVHLDLQILLVDEAHFYKNLGLPTNVEGFQVQASQRAVDLEMKLRWLERHKTGPFAGFFTATAVSNNMGELYTMAWYLDQPRLLRYSLICLDAFIINFVEISEDLEIAPDGKTFRMKMRPRRFYNLTDFTALFTQFADIQPSSILDEKRPSRQDITITSDPTPEMNEYIKVLINRAAAITKDKNVMYNGVLDNMLRIVLEGRQLATSPRLREIETGESPKVKSVAEEVLKVYQRVQSNPVKLRGEFQGLQIIFCDLGTPNKEKGDQVYGEIKQALMDGGIPSWGIRYIHEAHNDSQKADLFAACREGEVAVLIGSTEKLGTGTNIQNRCAALHIVAPPYRPGDVDQCIGRAHRPGNCYSTVQIFRHVVKGTFDAYMWQILERKARFIAQFLNCQIQDREMDAVSDLELTYAEVKAAATGDGLILEHATIGIEIGRIQNQLEMYLTSCKRAQQEANHARVFAKQYRERAGVFQKMAERVNASEPGFHTLEGDQVIEDFKEAGKHISQFVFTFLSQKVQGWRHIGNWSGFKLFLAVEGDLKRFNVGIVVGESGDEHTRISINPSWIGNGEQERVGQAISDFFNKTVTGYGHALAQAQEFEESAVAYDEEAKTPFPQEERLRTLVERKLVLDAYITLTASNASSQEIDARRRQLLATAEKDYTQDLKVESTALAETQIDLITELIDDEVSDYIAFKGDTSPLNEAMLLAHLSVTANEQVAAIPLESLVARSLFDDAAPLTLNGLAASKKKTNPRKKGEKTTKEAQEDDTSIMKPELW